MVGDIQVETFSGTKNGNIEVINMKDGIYSIKMSGTKKGKYTFTIIDEKNNKYDFEYHYDKKQQTVVLNKR